MDVPAGPTSSSSEACFILDQCGCGNRRDPDLQPGCERGLFKLVQRHVGLLGRWLQENQNLLKFAQRRMNKDAKIFGRQKLSSLFQSKTADAANKITKSRNKILVPDVFEPFLLSFEFVYF